MKFISRSESISVSANSIPHQGVEIVIKDNGIGLNKQMIDSLFKLDDNTGRQGTEGESSTGLRLIICNDFIEKHDRKLEVDSEEGAGSTFRFTLPACKSRNQE